MPLKGEYEQAIIYSIINEDPEPLHDFRKDIPINIVKIVKRAREKQPEARFQTMSSLVEEIETFFTTSQAPPTKAMILKTLYVLGMEVISPFDRALIHGFRCAKYV